MIEIFCKNTSYLKSLTIFIKDVWWGPKGPYVQYVGWGGAIKHFFMSPLIALILFENKTSFENVRLTENLL